MILNKTLLIAAMFLAAASGTVSAGEKGPNDLSEKVLSASEKCRSDSLEIGILLGLGNSNYI